MKTDYYYSVVFLSIFIISSCEQRKPIVCYYTFWGKDKDLQPEKIDASLCTHIIAGFASVSQHRVSASDEKLNAFRQVAQFKQTYPELKVMFSIGGGGKDKSFGQAVSSSTNRRTLIESILNVIDDLGMDGVDLDWEFPSWFSSIMEKRNFAIFLEELRATFDIQDRKILLSVAVAAKPIIVIVSYDANALAKYCDFINLMTYGFHDYHRFEDPMAEFNSPLYPRRFESWIFTNFNLAGAAEYWVNRGVPRSKIYVGIPTYAHSYVLAIPSYNDVGSLAVDGGQDKSYSQCCDLISNGATVKFHNESLVPYLYKDTTWLSFETEESVSLKAEWIKKHDFGGVMIFNLNSDDWIKSCGDTDYPLIKTINKIYN